MLQSVSVYIHVDYRITESMSPEIQIAGDREWSEIFSHAVSHLKSRLVFLGGAP